VNDNMNMGQPIDEDEISLLDLLLVISENIKLLVAGPIVAGLIALGYGFTITPVFTAKTTVLPPGSGSTGTAAALMAQLGPLADMAGIGGSGGGAASVTIFLESDTLADKLVEKFDLKKYYNVELATEARNALKGATKVISERKSNLISIEVTDKDPAFAATLANYYVEAARETMGRVAAENAKTQREFLERQIEEALKKPYQSPIIRDAMVQGLIRQVEAARIDEARDGPVLTQVDRAIPPELKSGPKKAMMAVITALAAGFALLLFVFIRHAMANAQQDAESAAKLNRIQQALFFWRK
jgi:uncharacterized protein involved in exopolysaccharide biosynthesis